MPQDTLHNNLVLNFSQEIVGHLRVEDLLDGYWGTVEETLMDDREATLADLVTKLEIIHGDLSHSGHHRKSTLCHRNLSVILSKGGKVRLMDFFLQVFDLSLKALLLLLLVAEFVFELSDLLVRRTCRCWTLKRLWLSTGAAASEVHPVSVIRGPRRTHI